MLQKQVKLLSQPAWSKTLSNALGLTSSAQPKASLSTTKALGVIQEASFDYHPFKLHHLDEGPSTCTQLTRDEALKLYRDMVVIRRMETAAANLYKEKAIRGFCHLCSGQEAIYVGMGGGIRMGLDSIITSYRAHGFTYVMGQPVLGVLGELCGKTMGCVRGKGGSMHMYAPNFYGGNGIVGAQVPLGAGIAFAHKYKGDGGVNFALYGDGAASQGQIAEAFNLAKLWDLPAVFVCENNHYGMGTSEDRHSASTEFFKRGDYIPGIQVDGMDILAVREATRFAIEYCGSGKGPLVYEISTYRYHGHSMSDPGTSYRSRDEVQQVRQTRDPITGFRERIVGAGLVEAAEVKNIEQQVKKDVDADVKKVKAGVELGVEELFYDIYENNLHAEGIKGITAQELWEHKKTQQALNL